ncbi:hypothetical protein CRUP_001790, partial [Coryphaenoides rupestris]
GSGSLAGILSALCVALVGSLSGYYAYQKKKLCFKNREVNTEELKQDIHAFTQSGSPNAAHMADLTKQPETYTV